LLERQRSFTLSSQTATVYGAYLEGRNMDRGNLEIDESRRRERKKRVEFVELDAREKHRAAARIPSTVSYKFEAGIPLKSSSPLLDQEITARNHRRDLQVGLGFAHAGEEIKLGS